MVVLRIENTERDMREKCGASSSDRYSGEADVRRMDILGASSEREMVVVVQADATDRRLLTRARGQCGRLRVS